MRKVLCSPYNVFFLFMNAAVRDLLESIYTRYHKPQYLSLDPLEYVRQFSRPEDIEIAGLVASSLAYGMVETIRSNIRKLFAVTGKNLYDFVRSTSFSRKRKMLHGFKHRFNGGDDLALLLECVCRSITAHGSLHALFHAGLVQDGGNIKQPMNEFVKTMRTWAVEIGGAMKKSFLHLLPLPEEGSACKRLNMYLRWMVRDNDGIDMGIWTAIRPAQLVMPVDTHVSAIARRLHLTSRSSADWRMAEEITRILKKISPSDPIKYDFSLCRAGMTDFRSSSKGNHSYATE